jgi:hypothetical protein
VFIKTMLVLVAFITSALAYIDAEPIMGQIRSEPQVDKIAVDTDETPIYAVFYWDEEMQLWVRVVGQTGNQLGEFNLSDGDMITLKGSGKFTLEVFSKSGVGNWEVEFSNTKNN